MRSSRWGPAKERSEWDRILSLSPVFRRVESLLGCASGLWLGMSVSAHVLSPDTFFWVPCLKAVFVSSTQILFFSDSWRSGN